MPPLAKFAVGMVMLVVIPRLSRRVHIPANCGVAARRRYRRTLCSRRLWQGPADRRFSGRARKTAPDVFCGLWRSISRCFGGPVIARLPLASPRQCFRLLLGTIVGLAFGYGVVPAIVIGSLLASHTLLGLPIVSRLGLGSLESVTVAVGATVMSDTLSLVVFAICVSIYTTGFSPAGLALLACGNCWLYPAGPVRLEPSRSLRAQAGGK